MYVNPNPVEYYLLFVTLGYISPNIVSLIISIVIYVLAQRASSRSVAHVNTLGKVLCYILDLLLLILDVKYPSAPSDALRSCRDIGVRAVCYVTNGFVLGLLSLPLQGENVWGMLNEWDLLAKVYISTFPGDHAQNTVRVLFDHLDISNIPTISPRLCLVQVNLQLSRQKLENAFSFCGTMLEGKLSHGEWSDPCASESVRLLIDVLMCWLMLGAVGNPIITILTQNTYLNRVALMLNSCTTHCCPTPLWKGVRINRIESTDDDDLVREFSCHRKLNNVAGGKISALIEF